MLQHALCFCRREIERASPSLLRSLFSLLVRTLGSRAFLTGWGQPRAKTRRNAIGHSAGPKRGRQHEQQSGHSADALNLAKNPQSERAVSGRPTWVLLTLCPDSAIIGARHTPLCNPIAYRSSLVGATGQL